MSSTACFMVPISPLEWTPQSKSIWWCVSLLLLPGETGRETRKQSPKPILYIRTRIVPCFRVLLLLLANLGFVPNLALLLDFFVTLAAISEPPVDHCKIQRSLLKHLTFRLIRVWSKRKGRDSPRQIFPLSFEPEIVLVVFGFPNTLLN